MGGDDQSTEGTESSHESEKGKISKNNYEFQLISEVREINPTIPICVLPWAFPGWIGNTPYDNVTETAEYVVNWLKIGRDTWNFDTFCVGVWNERNFSESYVKVDITKTFSNFGSLNPTGHRPSVWNLMKYSQSYTLELYRNSYNYSNHISKLSN